MDKAYPKLSPLLEFSKTSNRGQSLIKINAIRNLKPWAIILSWKIWHLVIKILLLEIHLSPITELAIKDIFDQISK